MGRATDAWEVQKDTLGSFIKGQRHLANLSLRQLSELTTVSNAYLSQIERGLHAPSVRVLSAIADALGVSAETLLRQAGLADEDGDDPDAPGSEGAVETAILADPRLGDEQKTALISVYRSYLGKA